MPFEFAAPARIIFGEGTAQQLPPLARAIGKRALLVTGASPPPAVRQLTGALSAAGLRLTHFAAAGEPTIDMVDAAIARAREARCDFVISIGGGSVIDTGKASAALIPNPGAALDYLEVIGAGKTLQAAPLPFIALPTTAGTGAEATKNAVLAAKAQRVKVSLRDSRMLADIALVDPLLTHSVPPAVTASTGMDALTQVLEPFVTPFASPLTDGFCREGLSLAGRALRRAVAQPNDAAARRDMALCSLLGGLALANAKLGAVHGFAGVLGGMFSAPHGAVCAALLPAVIDANLTALSARQPDSPALPRYDAIARLLLDAPAATAADARRWLRESSQLFGIPGLGRYGVRLTDFPEIIEKSAASSSMRGNPIALNSSELEAVLAASL